MTIRTYCSLFVSLVAFASAACSGSSENASSSESAQTARASCTAPRRSAAPTPTPAVTAKLDAWTAADAAYQKAAAVIGKACATDADCATGDDQFPGSCYEPYYGQAQCTVANAPSMPVLTCADYTCPAGFECEQEGSSSVVCLEHRSCGATGGRGGGSRQ